MSQPIELRPLSQEFERAQLGDLRRRKRLMTLIDSSSRVPGASLPVQAGSDGALEGTYRFLHNEEIRPEAILEPHLDCTVERAVAAGTVVVIHDTTSLEFKGEGFRSGLGPLRGKGQGFFAHYSFGVSEAGEPLGVLALHAWRRGAVVKGRRGTRQAEGNEDRESLRWHDGVLEVAERLGGRAPAIHVMDREGDSYELFADLLEHDQQFVIRLAHDRKLATKGLGEPKSCKLFEALTQGEFFLEREVRLSHRRKPACLKQAGIYPARAARTSRLSIRACPLDLSRSQHLPLHVPESLHLNFVEVQETDPPQGQPPVIWRLVTTLPIETPEQVARVVDLYRRRWQIEEFFKAIKTGCSFEKLQLESGDALIRALVIYSTVAWRLLLLRWLEHSAPDERASLVLTPAQMAVLKAVRRAKGKPLPEIPSVRDVLLAIAALGGHLRNNGSPGWQILGRGFDSLLLLEQGWLAAQLALANKSPQGDVIDD